MPPRKRQEPVLVDVPQFRQPEMPNTTREPVNPVNQLLTPMEREAAKTVPTVTVGSQSPISLLRGRLGKLIESGQDTAAPERTTTSASRTEPKPSRERVALDPESALKATIAVVALMVIAGSWAVRLQTRRQLRKPTPTQSKAIAEPLSKIFSRHFDMGGMAPDLLNGVEAAVGINDYLMDGPLVVGPEIRTGVPKGDLNREETNHAI